jgi:hypothetical protein
VERLGGGAGEGPLPAERLGGGLGTMRTRLEEKE